MLPIMWEQGECWMYVCVSVVWGLGSELGTWSGIVGWCYVCFSCESGLFV